MDAFIEVLSNAGPIGVISAVFMVLYRDTVKRLERLGSNYQQIVQSNTEAMVALRDTIKERG